jgi:hypothetical protein
VSSNDFRDAMTYAFMQSSKASIDAVYKDYHRMVNESTDRILSEQGIGTMRFVVWGDGCLPPIYDPSANSRNHVKRDEDPVLLPQTHEAKTFEEAVELWARHGGCQGPVGTKAVCYAVVVGKFEVRQFTVERMPAYRITCND